MIADADAEFKWDGLPHVHDATADVTAALLTCMHWMPADGLQSHESIMPSLLNGVSGTRSCSHSCCLVNCAEPCVSGYLGDLDPVLICAWPKLSPHEQHAFAICRSTGQHRGCNSTARHACRQRNGGSSGTIPPHTIP